MNLKPRAEGSKPIIRKVLIVCEGQETEPNYFVGFRVAKTVCEVRGTGRNTLSLVQEAKRLASLRDYREVWCVFDRDSFSEAAVTRAFELAKKEGFKVAFSNECFELWYILHFQYLDTEISRKEYSEKLKKHLGAYKKNSNDMYVLLKDKQMNAIQNAKSLLKRHPTGLHPCKCKPYTTVHKLVERLNVLSLDAK